MVANEKEVVAIVATYNEGERLRPVLESLSKCELILDIVVVDDGSKDPPLWASDFPKVRLFRHDKNVGKGAAMETGVRATDATYIFFCDADLVGFLPEHAVAIIKPVISGEYRTFLGLRENKEQQAVLLFALNSGERCLYRSDWETLPRFYKKGFRVETGLNFFTKKRGEKFGYALLPYRQTLKERKYGMREGIKERWRMIYEVGTAYLRIIFYDFLRPDAKTTSSINQKS